MSGLVTRDARARRSSPAAGRNRQPEARFLWKLEDWELPTLYPTPTLVEPKWAFGAGQRPIVSQFARFLILLGALNSFDTNFM